MKDFTATILPVFSIGAISCHISMKVMFNHFHLRRKEYAVSLSHVKKNITSFGEFLLGGLILIAL